MLSLLFLAVCIVFGYELITYLVPDTRRLFVAISPSKKVISNIPDLLFKIPAGIIVGISIATFLTYYISLGFSYVLDRGQTCQIAGTAVSTAILCYLIFMFIGKNRKNAPQPNSKIPEFNKSIFDNVFYGLSIVAFTCAASFLVFYTYRISDGIIENGYSVFSDLAPHTAMTSSFGVGSNFPTQYIHFAGDGIQYHFLFYFFCGLMQFLGLPIDYAINLPSIIGMVCCFCLLGVLGVLLTRKRATFVLAPVFVLFRSAFNVFTEIKEMTAEGMPLSEALKVLKESTTWFDNTPYDNWGIWAINVYSNQRHLLWGVALILVLVILFAPHVRRLCISMIGNKKRFNTMFLTKNAWIPRKDDPLHPIKNTILAVIIVIIMPYYHGSALIAGLLILFGMAIISENRLCYASVAVCAVVSSFIQTRIFSGNYKDFVLFTFVKGFVCEDKTSSGVMKYLIYITGLTLIIAFVYAAICLIKDIKDKKPIYRTLLLVCFLFPLIFAFNVQVSLEMLANHKFIQISLIMIDIFSAGFIANLLSLPVKVKRNEVKLPELLPLDNDDLEAMLAAAEAEEKVVTKKQKKEYNSKGKKRQAVPQTPAKKELTLPMSAYVPTQILSIIVAIVLIIGLTGTGIAEWCVYINLNKNHLDVDTNSELVAWIKEKTSPSDVFLTPMWYTNRFFLAGRPTYYGWPYYAWSAGHDTNKREAIYYWLLSGCNNDVDAFVSYCKEREIRYVVFDPEFYSMYDDNGYPRVNTEFFMNNLKQVAYFPNDNDTIIYQVY